MPVSDSLSSTAIRTIRVLKAFTDEQPALRFNELLVSTGLPKSTLVRFLNTLEVEGLVAHDRQTGHYRLGPELIVLGERALRHTRVYQVALPLLEALATASGETVDLDVLNDRDVITLASVPGKHVLSTGRFVGMRWPAHATATGKVLLAFAPAAQSDAFLAGPLAASTPHTLVNPAELKQELSRVRQQGYAVAREELELHMIAIAAPVYNERGDVIAAVSVSGPRPRIREDCLDDLVTRVRETSNDISGRMGSVRG